MTDQDQPEEGKTARNGRKAPALKRVFERAADFHPSFFPAEIGLDPQKYHQKKPAEYAGVKFFAEQGWIHGVHADVVPQEKGGVKIAINHWVHRPDGDNIVTPFMEVEAAPAKGADGKPVIRITGVTLQGEKLDINDRRTVSAAVTTCQRVMEELRLERRMPLLNKVAESAGLKTRPLPATYKDGNARLAYESGEKQTNKMLRIPAQFLPAVTAFFEEGYEATSDTPVLFHAAARDPRKGGGEYALYSQMERGAKGQTDIFMRLAHKAGNGENAYRDNELVRFKFRPVKGSDGAMVELAQADMDGRCQRVSDHKNIVRLLHFAHDANLQTRHGIIPDLAEIISYTNTQQAISGLPALSKDDGARYTYRVLGGNPSGARLFEQENGIGANCFLHLYEWFDDKGEYKSDAVMVDIGVTPLNRDQTGFDGMMAFAGQYFEHRANPKHKPAHKVNTLVITHPHLDHFLGLPHLLLAGYVVDHVACNEATKMYIEKACRELEVPAEYMPKKWTVVKDEIDLKAGQFDLSFGWIPHSAITNWVNVKTPEGSTLHFSDAKVDEHVMSHPPANVARLSSLKPTMAIVDSTRASQEDETESERSLEQKIVDFANDNPDKGMIAFHIGSNAARMTTFVNAYGRTGRHTVVFGAAIRFLKQVLDKVGIRGGFGIKAHAKTEHGIDVVNFTPNAKRAGEILSGDPGKQGILATGTHNEVMSIANRLIENKDQKNLGFITPQNYVAVLSQTGIPGNTRGWKKLVDWFERRGFEYRVIHASGHEGRKGIEKMLGWAGAKYAVATHGNLDQRGNAESVIRNVGMESLNPVEQDVIQVSDKNGCKIIAQDPSVMVYFSIKRPSDRHYGGGEDVEYYAHMVRPQLRTPSGDMIRGLTQVKKDTGADSGRLRTMRANVVRKDPILNLSGTNLSPRQKRVHISLPDYLVQNGIMRRVVFDCETTQLGRYAWITQFAGKQSNWFNDDDVKHIDIRQTLPETVLPDLDALLITDMTPDDIYRSGEGYFPPRQFYHEITKFLQDSKNLGPETGSKIWLDGASKIDDPSRRRVRKTDGDPYMNQSVQWSAKREEGEEFKIPHSVTVKTLVGGYNNTRADDVWLQHAGFRAGALRYSPTNTGGMRRFDLRNMVRMYAFLRPDQFKVRTRPDSPGFLDFSVEGVMKANNLGYEKYKAHDGKGDVEMEDGAILKHMLNTDTELFTQCVLNANPKEVKKFLAGSHNGMLYPRHLLTYINGAARDARANIGVYVGRSTDKKYMNRALLFNVSDFDPKDFEGMSAQEMAEIMGNPSHRLHKAFELIQINQQPLLASADRGFDVSANRGTSLETMKGYKHFIERHPQMAATMIRAMEMAKVLPERDPRMPMEERVYSAPFMEMSSHDRDLAKLFTPTADEFTDADYADTLNRQRAAALDKMHSVQLRERYVAVLYQAQREYKQLFGKDVVYLHPRDHARERAKEKARIHGLIDTEAMSLGRLEAQIKRAHADWDKRMAGKTLDQRKRAEDILRGTENLVQDIKSRIANNDPEWALTRDDYALLGLDDNIPYGRYQAPVEKNPSIKTTDGPANDDAKKPSRRRKPKGPEQNIG